MCQSQDWKDSTKKGRSSALLQSGDQARRPASRITDEGLEAEESPLWYGERETGDM